MRAAAKRLPASFYRSPSGVEPVRQWLKGLPKEDRQIVAFDLATAEFGWPVGMPLCRSMGAGMWEIRSRLTGGRISRVLFCVAGQHMVLLHAFIKKSAKTPLLDLEIARHRQRETEK
ncbi:MAG TPA: type II toxin-antitoxin system RelE/ParE family toxin [Phycisphaerae bacterium]|nr:type II toxin-antitoxin system RelE/ParE family toxin [Phycisphaerae bacterium]